MLQAAYDRTMRLMTRNKSKLLTLANALKEYETLSGSELQDLIQGKKLKYYLESFGFNVVWVKNSVEGIKEITSRKATFVMIISDIQML